MIRFAVGIIIQLVISIQTTYYYHVLSFIHPSVDVVWLKQQQQQQQQQRQRRSCYFSSVSAPLLIYHPTKSHWSSYRIKTCLTITSNNNIDEQEINHKYLNYQWEYGHKSVAGTDPDRPNKVNQDGSFFVPPYIVNHLSITIFGVLDGHGKKGHDVVQYLQQQVPIRLQEYLERTVLRPHPNEVDNPTNTMTSAVNGINHHRHHNNETFFSMDEQKLELISIGRTDPSELYSFDSTDNVNNNYNYDQQFTQRIEAAIVDAFVHVQYDLRYNPTVPSSRSGTTCICCAVVEDKQQQRTVLYTATVGDSRCIMATSTGSAHNSNEDNQWNVYSLTNATTVKITKERNRLNSCGDESRIDTDGNVFYGPIGIAMTRSLGNSVMLRAGIIPIPIISKQQLMTLSTDDDDGIKTGSKIYYICAGTDGIFDVLSNEQVTGMIQEGVERALSLNEITINICHAAKLAWLAGLPIETKVDDCTVAILKLMHK